MAIRKQFKRSTRLAKYLPPLDQSLSEVNLTCSLTKHDADDFFAKGCLTAGLLGTTLLADNNARRVRIGMAFEVALAKFSELLLPGKAFSETLFNRCCN